MAFCCGTRLARVECLQKEGWGHPIPRFSRAKPAAAASHRRAHPPIHGGCSECNPYPNAAGVQKPRCPLRVHRTRGLHRLDPTLGSSAQNRKRFARISVEAHICFSFSVCTTPCESRLFTQSPKTAYVFTVATHTSFTTGPVHRSCPLTSAVHSLSALRALRSFAAPVCRSCLPPSSCLHAAVPLSA